MTETELRLLDAYWRAANYLSVGQIYLLDNPLLREPLAPEHVKPRLLGHWGTTPGLNFLYVAPEPGDPRRATSTRSTSPAPATAAPALVANAYLEGTYSELYPHVAAGRGRAARALPPVLVPGRDPEPRRARDARARSTRAASSATRSSHAYGAAFDNPDLLVCCVVGDGEAETGPLATSWHSNKFLEPGDATAPCCRSCT